MPIPFGNPEVFDNESDNGSSSQPNCSISRCRRNREFRARHSSRNRGPRGGGWSAVRAGFVVLGGDDTLGSRRKQDEESDVEEDRNGRSEELSDELVLRLGTEEVTCLKVTGHVRSLGSGSGGNDSSGQIEGLSWVQAHTSRFSDTTENDLGGLGDSGDGVNVGSARTLDTDEGEKETKDEGENSLSDIEVE